MAHSIRLHWLFACLGAMLAVAACEDAGSAAAGTSGDGTSTTSGSSTTLVTGTGGFDSSGGGDDSPMGECFLWDVDECGEGRKCMPWSDEPDRIPDETKCCPAMEKPDLVGETCSISGYDGSCMDSCEVGSMCVLDDEESLTGVCRLFCNPTSPVCEADQTCKAFFEMIPLAPNIPMCMDKCDPVVQDCAQSGWNCIPDTPTEAGQSGFICVPPPPGQEKALFDACALANDCGAGLVCLTDDRVPGCGFTSCCTAFCSLSEGNGPCQALHPDLQCVDWMSPDPEWEDVGACAIPS